MTERAPYRSVRPPLPCERHADADATVTCVVCGALLCDRCRVFAPNCATCRDCRAPDTRRTGGIAAIGATIVAVALWVFSLSIVARHQLVQSARPAGSWRMFEPNGERGVMPIGVLVGVFSGSCRCSAWSFEAYGVSHLRSNCPNGAPRLRWPR
jgi:hypothetical protein